MQYRDYTDETLVMLTLAGDGKAYEGLVLRYERAVIAAAASVTRNRYLAEDAAQDAFVTAWMKLNTLQNGDKFGAWVARIAKNCAKNMLLRFRSLLPLEMADTLDAYEAYGESPEAVCILSEEQKEIDETVARLPARVREIIRLYYFEGLSIPEIAERTALAVGTVKWQLSDGRKRIRKDLCAMNETWNDTLVQKVMKKVEELKLFQLQNNKNGFEEAYRDVLREIEELPECQKKDHALADVLMRGWWWLHGKKNDALFARIREAAERGRNDDVMSFVVGREDANIWGDARITLIRDKQIPRLEAMGFTKALAREWFWLGYEYFQKEDCALALSAFERVRKTVGPAEPYYALAAVGTEQVKRWEAMEEKPDLRHRSCILNAKKLRYIDGAPRFWSHMGFGHGFLQGVNHYATRLLRNASYADGHFFIEGLTIGESYTASDGTTLTFVSERETVDTPAGRFDGCQLWETRRYEEYLGSSVYRTYYKAGVGIVRSEHLLDGMSDVMQLSSYRIVGGRGLLPMAAGNEWSYEGVYDPALLKMKVSYRVTHADGEGVVLSAVRESERFAYDESSWSDMIYAVRNEYHDSQGHLCDVSHYIARAEALAKTPLERAHTRAAASVARRIMETDMRLNKNASAIGQWNFFAKKTLMKEGSRLRFARNSRWSFMWKNAHSDDALPLLYNDIFGILQDATGCVFSDEWQDGTEVTLSSFPYEDMPVETKLSCRALDALTVAAGRFENVLCLSLDISGMGDGLDYRNGKREYYFADGIGIIRTESEYGEGKRAVYELTAYEGRGEGYLPFFDGMLRRYEAIGLTGGYFGAAEYTCAADESGELSVFADRTGIRDLSQLSLFKSPTDEYEEREARLWEASCFPESRARHDATNFHLLTHFLGRQSRHWGAAKRGGEWGKFRIKVMESLGKDGRVPPAWLGHYFHSYFMAGCAYFGCGEVEEGFRCLDRALELYPDWARIPKGTAMEVGDEHVFGGVKVIKGENVLELPDGTREPITKEYEYLFNPDAESMYSALTAPTGWGWFNSVRTYDRFKEYTARVKALMDAEKEE